MPTLVLLSFSNIISPQEINHCIKTKINPENILVFLKLHFLPQAPTEKSVQFILGVELRVSRTKRRKVRKLF